MSIVHPKSQWQWLLLMLLSFVLVHAFETPTKIQCEHDSIPDLIKSSPVILKALGARIFTDYENYPFQDDIEFTEELMLRAQRRNLVGDDGGDNNVLPTGTATGRSGDDTNSDGSVSSSSSSDNRLDDDNDDDDDDAFLSADTVTARAMFGMGSVEGGIGRDGAAFNSHQWSGSESTLITLTPETIYKGASALKITQPDRMGESSYQYEEQLNATLEPLACFNSNILKLLPTEIIAFGKLVNDRRPDVLRISINGLHRWSPQFENRIWKYLGWDDWSDFTVCSVQCGKGVQQRFRRCLLDNPMISINMNLNGNEFQHQQQPERLPEPLQQQADTLEISNPSEKQSDAPNQQQQHHHHHHQLLHSRGSNSNSRRGSNIKSHSDNQEKNNASNISNNNANGTKSFPAATDGGGTTADSVSSNKLKKRRKRKKAKSLSTLSCEGYNIEQRNCNTFECTDDISDLLKFYKKFLPMEELPTTSVPQQPEQLILQSPTAPDSAQSPPVATTSSSGSSVPVASTTSTTLPNTGYIRSWKNSLNFTLMITLRLKNDTKSTLTVFSIRNTTHNLYVETAADGLRLYQERDNATEMLPVKFQLYDNRWHQVSISIQNGDFISIYVDCTWTNSFVVSKRLFSLPTDADVEIGRGFNGELQQLLILPENQERHQCSNVRTSINEVKRYIIDTFIEDYGN